MDGIGAANRNDAGRQRVIELFFHGQPEQMAVQKARHERVARTCRVLHIVHGPKASKHPSSRIVRIIAAAGAQRDDDAPRPTGKDMFCGKLDLCIRFHRHPAQNGKLEPVGLHRIKSAHDRGDLSRIGRGNRIDEHRRMSLCNGKQPSVTIAAAALK